MKGSSSAALRRVLKYIQRRWPLLALSILLAAASVAGTLYVPILIGDAIEGQYIAGNLHFAAAIAFIMMVALLAAMALMKYLTGRNVKGGV